MQIIYDSTGKIFMHGNGFPVPEGTLSYMEVTVPDNSYIAKLDMSKNPVEPVFAEYPKTDIELMKDQMEKQQADLDYLKLLSGDEEV